MDRAAAPAGVARVLITSDGRYVEGNALAHDLLGVTCETLRTHVVGDFTLPELREPSRASWQHMAQSGTTAYLIDETILVRPDGTAQVVRVLPVRPGDEPGTWWSQFEPIPGPRGRVLSLAKPQQVLAAWRAAERRAADLEPGSPERQLADRTVEGLGSLYRVATDLRLKATADA